MKRIVGLVRSFLIITAFALGPAVAAPPSSAPPRTGKLSIGWASTDITPSEPAVLCGQFRLRISKRINDPLTATALAIEARNEKGVVDQVVIVSVDVVCIRRVDLERVRSLARERVPDLEPSKIILCATHTHTAPVLADANEPNVDPYDLMAVFTYPVPEEGVVQPNDYINFFANRVTDAVVEAWKNRRPGGVSWALSYAVVGHNRRAHYLSGRAQMYGPTDKPDFDSFESTDDPGVELLFTWDADRKLTGVAVNVACPSQEVENADYISADFWHDARMELRRRHGTNVFILPLCGAAGDQSPHLLFRKQAEATLRRRKGDLTPRQEIGRRIAAAVDSGLELCRNEVHSEVPFTHTRQLLPLPVRKVTKEECETARKGYLELEAKGPDKLSCPSYLWWRIRKNIVARYEFQNNHPTCDTEVHTLRLGDIAIATNPFELFVDYGLRMKSRSPAEQTFVIQLACDSLGYLPTERAIAGGHYSAEIMSNVIGPKGGQMLVDQTVKILKCMWPAEQ